MTLVPVGKWAIVVTLTVIARKDKAGLQKKLQVNLAEIFKKG